jgi:cell division protease FtsH
MSNTTTQNFDYSTFLSKVDANKVHTASINPEGAITGTLKNGDQYTSQIPTAITDDQLAPTLKAHHVSVTGVGQGSSVLTDLLTLLPFLLFIAFFVWMGRRGRKVLSGVMGIGGSRPRSTTSKSL